MQIAKSTLPALVALSLAVSVLFASIYKATAVNYKFTSPNDSARGAVFVSGVEYSLPYPGILPDHPLWFTKAARDKVWLVSVRDPLERASVTLFLADKRLMAAKQLFDKGQTGLGVATAIKAEKYLEKAQMEGRNAQVHGRGTDGFFETLAQSSLAHREVLEEIIATVAPEDAKAHLIQAVDYPKAVYEQSAHQLNAIKKPVPGNGAKIEQPNPLGL